MIKRFLVALAAAIVGLVGGLTVTTSPAQASWSDCAAYDNTLCMTEHSNFTGQVWRQYRVQIPVCRNLTSDSFNDEASTVFNLTDDSVFYLYEHINCTGAVLSVGPGEVKAFNQVNTWWNDRASSVYARKIG